MGVFSTVGGVQYRQGISWVPWGDILSTVGGVQYHGGYHDKCGGISWVPWGDIMINVGGYLEYRGGVQYRGGISWVPWGLSWVPWGMFSAVGGYHDACGGYHEYRGGCSVPWGKKSFVIWVPHGTEHPPRYSWYPPTCIMISPHSTQISKDGIPTVLNTPHGTHDIPPRASWYPPTVLKITPTVLKITPHGTHDTPHGTEHPHGTQDIPHGTHDIPHGTEHPPRYCTHIIQGEQQDLSKKVYISEAEIANENSRTTTFGEKGLFICGQIYLGKQLLPQINNCCQEVLQNNEMTCPWSKHCWMLVACGKTTTQVAVLALNSKSQDCAKHVCVRAESPLSRAMVERWEMLRHFSASCGRCQ